MIGFPVKPKVPFDKTLGLIDGAIWFKVLEV